MALATAATAGVVGAATLYLPFVADKDKIRGMFEEGEESIPEGARREIREIMKKEAEQQRELEEQLSRREAEAEKEQPQKKGGSMWSSFRRN